MGSSSNNNSQKKTYNKKRKLFLPSRLTEEVQREVFLSFVLKGKSMFHFLDPKNSNMYIALWLQWLCWLHYKQFFDEKLAAVGQPVHSRFFCNTNVLKNIHGMSDILHLDTNGGTLKTNKKGVLKNYGEVWYSPEAITNILSLKNIIKNQSHLWQQKWESICGAQGWWQAFNF